LNNLFVHLTNNAIQKTSESYNKSCDLKWPMRQLKMYMISKYGKKRVEECFYEIEMVMIRALLAVSFFFLFLKILGVKFVWRHLFVLFILCVVVCCCCHAGTKNDDSRQTLF